MKLFFELQEQAKRSVLFNYRCCDCICFKQESEPTGNDNQRFYYHICNLNLKKTEYSDAVCINFEPNKEIKLQYRLDLQEKLQELMYEEICDKLYDHIM